MKNYMVIMLRDDISEVFERRVSAKSTADAVAQIEREFAEECNYGGDWAYIDRAYIVPMTEALTLPIGGWKRKHVKPQSL